MTTTKTLLALLTLSLAACASTAPKPVPASSAAPASAPAAAAPPAAAPDSASTSTGTGTGGRMSAGTSGSAGTGGVAPSPPSTPDAEFRAQKPPALAAQSAFEAPVPVERKLRNGARLLVVENHSVPLVAVHVLIEAGNDRDPAGKPGLADFVANMLDEGTLSRTAPQLAEAIENLAARISIDAGPEATHVALNSLKETLPQALDLLADVLLHPAFRPQDLERTRGLMLTDLLKKKGSASALARDEMGRLLFGEKHPWGQPSGGTPESVAGIGQAELKKFHETWFRPNNALIVVSGDVTPAEAQKLFEERLAGWKRKALPKLKLPAPPELKARTVTLIDMPGASQSQLWVVGRLFPARDPDAVALRLGNVVLGGQFGSRLNLNLREDKGYSYGVSSQAVLRRTTGLFFAAGGIVAKSTAEALVEYEKELRTFASGGVTDEELARAKDAWLRSLPTRLETNDAVAASIATEVFNGEPLDYFRTIGKRIAAVTRADVARVAQKYVKPEVWPVVIVGPKALSEEKLRSKEFDFGHLEVKEPEAPGKAAAPVPAASGATAG